LVYNSIGLVEWILSRFDELRWLTVSLTGKVLKRIHSNLIAEKEENQNNFKNEIEGNRRTGSELTIEVNIDWNVLEVFGKSD
jgi:hypothetical protein